MKDAARTLSFFLPGEPEFARLQALDPDREPTEFQTAERAWTLQTYLRLRRAGLPVELCNELPRQGVVVFHAKHKNLVQQQRRSCHYTLLVALRGDRGPVLNADFEVLQNSGDADHQRTFEVPHWPQPGLKARDPNRGPRLEVVAYKGFADNLDPAFLNGRWSRGLAELDIDWICDAAPFDRHHFRHYPVDWASFREVDAVLAVRPPDQQLHPTKPASKLINAWLAGVPAILGPERAYRELRRSELDYLEAANVDEALTAVRRLREEEGLAKAMIANGQKRALSYDQEHLVEIWRQLLFEMLPALARETPRSRRTLPSLILTSWFEKLSAKSGI